MKSNTRRPDYVKLIGGPEGMQLQAACEVFWAAEKLLDTPNASKVQAQTFVNVLKTHFDYLVEFKACEAILPDVCKAELTQAAQEITEYYPSIYPAAVQETRRIYEARALHMQTVLPLVLSLL